MKDNELVQLIASEKERGTQELLRNYEPMLRYIISPILPDRREQDECLSDVVMRVVEKIGSYSQEKGSFKSWLSVVTRNTALNHAKKLRREPDMQSLDSDIVSSNGNPEEELIKSETLRKLELIVQKLSPKDKMLFYRRFYYCQSVSQIAAETGMTQRAAEGRLYRLKKKIREELGGESYE